MKSRLSVALAFREDVVCLGGNGLGYQEGVELFVLKSTVYAAAVTKKVHCSERMEINGIRRKKDNGYFR